MFPESIGKHMPVDELAACIETRFWIIKDIGKIFGSLECTKPIRSPGPYSMPEF
jgi:hypothetical protein